jgi:hypothetical protein
MASLCEWFLMLLGPFVLGCYVMGPLVMGPYVGAPHTYDHEGEKGEADGDNDVLCHVALAEALLQHRLVPAAHESLLLLKGLSHETDLAFDDKHG